MAVIFFAWTSYTFDQASRRSERHDYYYTIELSYTTTISNVTFLLPAPTLNETPVLITSILDRTAYGISPDWNISTTRENGTPMLAIRAARLVPEYHGYPVAIEPGASVLPTTLVPGREYSGDTPVLMPVTVAVMEPASSAIDTRDPVGHEPLFFPEGPFTPVNRVASPYEGTAFSHPVPVYVSYTADQPVLISLRVSVQGTNSIWRGGWQSNMYSDTVAIETGNGTQGWIEGEGELLTARGVYY